MSTYTLYRAFIKQRRPSGSTQSWQDVLPLTISWTDGNGNYTVISQNSPQCGYEPQPDPQYRWVNVPINQDYECDTTTYTKYYRQKKQVSHDNGATWNDVSPAQYQRGGVYESNSIDCGYVAPTGYKLTLGGPNGKTVDIPCDSNTELTSDNISYAERVLRYGYGSYAHYAIIGQCVRRIGNEAFEDSDIRRINSSVDGWCVIPDSVTSIGEDAFESCNYLTSVTIPDSVTSIEDGAFMGSWFVHVTIPSSVTIINDNVFRGSASLKSVTIPNTVTSIGDLAFWNCRNFETVTIPNSVTSIGHSAFANCYSLSSATIGNSVTSIGDNAFTSCRSLTGINIPSSVSYIGMSAFYGCSGITNVNIPNGVTSIRGNTFNECRSLTSITIPDSVTSIGDFAFSGCSSLTNLVSYNVTIVGYAAFSDCSGLTSVVFGSNINELGAHVFDRCEAITSITFLSTTPPTLVDGTSLPHRGREYAIYVPAASVSAYKTADVWTFFADRIFPIGS